MKCLETEDIVKNYRCFTGDIKRLRILYRRRIETEYILHKLVKDWGHSTVYKRF